ncbi:reverse transcriptase domain-containing protein [Tanacetum coccineum]|uniref:Reverse transcriptase domain-containing protein n=1 Tax=Tanacetum coccineum TaxID=301880 RepID=A0ABQ5H0P9_9ASTR
MGPLLMALGGARFSIVAIDYFTMWVKAISLVSTTGKQMEKFVWEHIVCKFRIPQIIISDNGKLFAKGIFPVFCQNLVYFNVLLWFTIPKQMGRSRLPTVILSRAWNEDLEKLTKDGWMSYHSSEIVVPIEISVETKRIKEFKVRRNKKRRREDLNILKERRDIASIREAYYKHKLEGYYNKRIRPSTFKPCTYIL